MDLEKVLEVAVSQDGVKETSRNRGPWVDEYIRAAGLDPEKGEYAWCVGLVRWCFKNSHGSNNPIPRTARVARMWAQGVDYRSQEPKRGHIFCHAVKPEKVDSDGHTGFVLAVGPGQVDVPLFSWVQHKDGFWYAAPKGKSKTFTLTAEEILTVEGNTNAAGGREGNAVAIKVRPKTYVNWGYLDFSSWVGVS